MVQADLKSIWFMKYKYFKMIQSLFSHIHTCSMDACNFLWLKVTFVMHIRYSPELGVL
jgi:hypothetical protein